MAYKISEGCLSCGDCFVECRFGAIRMREDESGYEIDPEKCVECDRCADECPLSLINRDESTPSRRRFTAIRIIEDKCIGCSLCARNCPVKAITGKIKSPYTINEEQCIKCGVCLTKCRKDAIKADYIA